MSAPRPISRLKVGCFVLEALNAFATSYYFNYLFFLLRDEFALGSRDRLWIAAGHGLLYVPMSLAAGRIAQRHGNFTALLFGFGGMALALGAGLFAGPLTAHLALLGAWTLALCLTWPAIEALCAEGEGEGLPRRVGIYNVVWAAAAGLAYFAGGALFEQLGRASLYWLPAGIHAAQFLLVLVLRRRSDAPPPTAEHNVSTPLSDGPAPGQRAVFLRLALLANPFSYMAINALLPMIPTLAERHGLSTTQSGLFFSLWFLVRVGAFYALWKWTAWHYRFRWLALAYAAMTVAFLVIVFAPTLAVVALAQVVFGVATGLIYYSSLFYAMDAGDAKGEHGGLHEAMLGVGICGGPALCAVALQFAPAHPHAAPVALGVLLTAGGAAMGWRKARGGSG